MPHSNELEFLTFRPELAHDFKAINEEWISDMFELEGSDTSILDHPQSKVIDPGGQIWFAKHGSLGIVGTCALMPQGDGDFELTKMGVFKSARGLKVGEKLLQHVLEAAREMPISKLFLLTNKHCEAAIHLYLKNGFEHDAGILQSYACTYERCDVAMIHRDFVS